METMPPYTYKFVKNQGSDSENQKKQNKKDKHGYLSKDVKVINDLIDDLSKLKTADHVSTTAAHAVTAAAAVATSTNTVAAATHAAAASGEMTNPLEIDNDKESLQSVSSSSSHRSTEPKAKQKEQVRHITFLLYKPLGPWVFINVRYSIVKDSNTDSWKLKFQNPFHNH
jgi:hypothetical protein